MIRDGEVAIWTEVGKHEAGLLKCWGIKTMP